MNQFSLPYFDVIKTISVNKEIKMLLLILVQTGEKIKYVLLSLLSR